LEQTSPVTFKLALPATVNIHPIFHAGLLKAAEGGGQSQPLPKPDKEGEYEIDKILGHRTRRDGKRVYLVKWKGYTYEECTWEPASHFKPHVLQSYHQSPARKEAKDEQYVSSSEEEEEAGDEQEKEQARPKRGNKRAKKAHLTLIDLKTGNRGNASKTVQPYMRATTAWARARSRNQCMTMHEAADTAVTHACMNAAANTAITPRHPDRPAREHVTMHQFFDDAVENTCTAACTDM